MVSSALNTVHKLAFTAALALHSELKSNNKFDENKTTLWDHIIALGTVVDSEFAFFAKALLHNVLCLVYLNEQSTLEGEKLQKMKYLLIPSNEDEDVDSEEKLKRALNTMRFTYGPAPYGLSEKAHSPIIDSSGKAFSEVYFSPLSQLKRNETVGLGVLMQIALEEEEEKQLFKETEIFLMQEEHLMITLLKKIKEEATSIGWQEYFNEILDEGEPDMEEFARAATEAEKKAENALPFEGVEQFALSIEDMHIEANDEDELYKELKEKELEEIVDTKKEQKEVSQEASEESEEVEENEEEEEYESTEEYFDSEEEFEEMNVEEASEETLSEVFKQLTN